MKPSDAIEVHALVEGRFPATEWGHADKVQFLQDIVVGVRDQVVAAVNAIHAEGKDWAPSAGALLRRAVLLEMDPPTWERVIADVPEWRRVQAALPPWTCPDRKCDGAGRVEVFAEHSYKPISSQRCSCWDRFTDRRWEGLHPLVGEAVRRDSLNLDHLRRAAQGDTTMAAQLRAQWTEFVSDAVESRLLAQVDGDAPRLQRAREDTHRRLGGDDAHRHALAPGAAGRLVRQLEAGEAVA